MNVYRIAVTLRRPLNPDEMNHLHSHRSTAICSYQAQETGEIIVSLQSPNSATALDVAEIQVSRWTGVFIETVQVVSAHLE